MFEFFRGLCYNFCVKMSEKTRVLEDNDFEGLRLYEPDSNLHKLIGDQVRAVFEKLFQNTDVNFDDFYFTGFDDDDPNAFFIEKSKTKDGKKNIIAVSYGLIQKLDSAQELAAIVGHESGHYLWSELLGGQNTIFQERGSDVYSVQLMINGGFNPRYVRSAQQKVFNNFSYSGVNLDVHGHPLNRIGDVEAYLTLLATKEGNFENIDNKTDPKYQQFKTVVEHQHDIDGYDTYLDKRLKEKFGTKDIQKIKRIDILRLFLDEIKDDKIVNYGVRLGDFMTKFEHIPMDGLKTSQELYNLHNIFFLLREKMGKDATSIQRQKSFLSHAKLYKFGPFMTQYDNISGFISCYDDEFMAEFFAKRICDLGWTVEYIHCFIDSSDDPYPAFRPLGAANIGKMLPWDKLKSYNNKNINSALRYFSFESNLWENNIYSRVQNFNEKDYYLDKDGYVIAYGDEAHKLYEEDKKRAIIKRFQVWVDENNQRLDNALNSFDEIDMLASGRLSVRDFCKDRGWAVRAYFSEIFNRTCVTSFRDVEEIKEYGVDTSAVWEQYNRVINSKYYKQLCAQSPEISLYPILPRDTDVNIIINAMDFLLHPQNLTNTYSKFIETILKVANTLSNEPGTEEKTTAGYLYDDLRKYKSPSPFTFDKEIVPQDILDKREQVDLYGVWESYQEQIIIDASHNSVITLELADYLSNRLDSDLSKNTKSDIFVNMMNSIGIENIPTTENELILVLNRLGGMGTVSGEKHSAIKDLAYKLYNNERDKIHNVMTGLFGNMGANEAEAILDNYAYNHRHYVKNTQLMFYLIASYINAGHKFDIIKVLDAFVGRGAENYSPPIRDILAQNITPEYFKKLPLMDKLRVYEFMNTRKLFSESAANKNNFIKTIVNEIIKYPEYDQAITVTQNILTRHGNTDMDPDWHRSDLEFANEREKLLDFYADYWAKKLGRDDGSDEYVKKLQSEFVDFINSDRNNEKDNKLFSSMMVDALADRVSNKIMAQEKCAKILGNIRQKTVSGEDAEKYDYYGRAAENAFNALANTPEKAVASIKFLNSKLTDESINELMTTVCKNDQVQTQVGQYINKETLSIIHENFWAAGLPIRAYLMNRLLGAYSRDAQKKLQLVIDMYFDANSKYYKDAVIVLNAVYNNLQDYEQQLILAALVASGQQDNKNGNMSDGTQVGRGLKMFLQTKGAAFVKFGQLLSYLPSLDPDIRRELSTLREQANIPTRAELFDTIKKSLPESEYKKISYVGKILGGGSFYVTVQVKYNGQDCVMAVMRPNTRKLTQDGIEMISDTINEMASKNKKFKALKNIVEQARDSAYSEIDIKQDYKKYQNAVKIYENIHVHTPSGDYSPDVAKWLAYGADQDNNNAYKIMEMAPGASLTSSELSEQEKHDFAVAYTTLELSILLSGAQWDTDRHAGQQNFYNRYFRDFCIGIFDTGAQMKAVPNKSDKLLLGYLLYALIRGARNGRSVGDVLTKVISKIDKVGPKLKIDTMYIDGVQRGLTALSDIIEYQKEVKDEDGKIVQKSKSLTATDLQNIITAILDSGIIDTTVMKSIKSNVIINKLLVGRRGWLKSLAEGVKKTTSNIRVTYTDNENEQYTVDLIVKAQKELQKLLDEENKSKHLGVKIGLTKKIDDAEQIGQLATIYRA